MSMISSLAKRVLLVDDEQGIRNVLGITLVDLGYEVQTAANADEALEKFDAFQPAIVLTDIKMPGLSGIDLLRAIKSRNNGAEVIMITGHGDMDLAITSLQHDACDFVTKPINPDVLLIALKRATERITMRAQLKEHTENLERLVEEKSERLLAAERQLAAVQVIEGLSNALSGVAGQVESGGVFNELPCLVSLHDPYLEIVATNQLYKNRVGDTIGNNSWEIYQDRLAEDQACPVAKTFSSGQGQRSDEIITTPDGREIPVTVHTAPIRGEHDVEYVLEISVDQEEAQRLRDELTFSQHRFRQLFDAVPCYISVQNRDFQLLETNNRFKVDFDAEPGSICYESYKHRSSPCPDCPVQKTFADGQIHESEEVVTTKNGEKRNVLVQTAPITNADGQIVQVMELSTDITQIRQLQDHLTSLGLLLGSVSHGVKGLLTALDGGMYRVESGLRREDDTMVQAGWKVVRQMTDRIRSMVLDILYYAKERDLNWEKVSVETFVAALADVIAPKAEEHAITFHRNIGENLGQFEVDSGVLSAALVNILENAVDACASDTSKPEHVLTLQVKKDGPDVVITVSDNGTGMDQETREKIFTLFFSSKGDRGTGLGLFIANQVVEKHGGNIHVESEVGQGTSFIIRLPRKLAEAAKNGNSDS